MVGTVRHSKGLETRSGRMKLKPRRQPYWRSIELGRTALGYQRKEAGKPGRWITRRWLAPNRYSVRQLGLADDYTPADGIGILTYEDAHIAARRDHGIAPGHMTVADAIAAYIAWLKTHRATGREAEQRARKLILPELGKIQLADLTARHLTKWRDELATQPAMTRSRPGAPQNYRPDPVTADDKRARRATVNRIWTILRAALNKAFVDGHVSTDTAWRRVEAFPQTNAARPGFLTAEEADGWSMLRIPTSACW
jgi:hypothetical protein